MPYAGQDFTDTTPAEIRNYGLNFAKLLLPGETLLGTPAISLSVVSGVDPNVSSRLSGTPSILGTVVFQQLKTLQPFCTYLLSASVQNSKGETLQMWSHVTCNNPS